MNTVAKYLCVLVLSGVACAANALVIHHPGSGFGSGFPVVNASWPSGLKLAGYHGLPAGFSIFLGGYHSSSHPVTPLPGLVFGHPHGGSWMPPVTRWQPHDDSPAAVWEPSTWLLMLLGFTMLILVRVRQSRLSRLQDSAA